MSASQLIAVRLTTGRGMLGVLEDIWAAGDAALPVDPTLPSTAVDDLLAAMRPAALIEPGDGGTDVRRRRLQGGEPVAPGTALVVLTSGATGTGKGVVLTHAALRTAVRASLDRLGCRPGHRWLLCLPLHHVAGVLVALRARELGSAPVVQPGFDTAAVARAEADYVSLVPTQLTALLDAGVDLSRFEGILLGGGPASPELLGRAAGAGAEVTVSYGLTETAGGCVYDGRALDPVEVEVTDAGRIAVRGPMLMAGYRRQPELTRRALDGGWLVTPDRGRLRDDGTLEVLGRADDIIVTGGENVSGRQVAAVLEGHPGIAEAAVVALPDDTWGQRVAAVVVAANGDPPGLEELRDFARDRLAPPALPRQLRVVAELPRTGLDKLDRGELAHLVGEDRLRRGPRSNPSGRQRRTQYTDTSGHQDAATGDTSTGST